MKRVALPVSLLLVVTWAILQPPEVLGFSAAFLAMRKAFTLLTGALALAWMGYCMLLALRPLWLERSLGGLDKLYKIHKWAGVLALALVSIHWLLILSPRRLMAWGWVEKVVRERHGHDDGFSLVGLAKDMGEWAAIALLVLGGVALLRFVPYSWFRKLHKGFPVVFLVGAFHSVMMLPPGGGTNLFGILVIAISLAGSVAALLSLAGRIGGRRQHPGKILSISTTQGGVLDLRIDPGPDWPGHAAGQFALLTLHPREGAHPFSIVSDWRQGEQLRFAIKPLGDYTGTLARKVRPGDAVTIEGPYGRFDFGDPGEDQVWVAGGIGVAPFVARLEKLASAGGSRGEVHFFYAAKNPADAVFPQGLEELCAKARVVLHRKIESCDGMIGHDEIGRFARQADGVWFCGPASWARALKGALQRNYGLSDGRFKRELFEFR